MPLIRDPSYWCGALARPGISCVNLESAGASDDGPPPSTWLPHAVPAENQNGDSCVGHAWANWIELMLRRHCGRQVLAEGEQIDGDAIWKYGRQRFWHGDLHGGLYLDQGFWACKELGLLPPGAELVQCLRGWRDQGVALEIAPLIVGHAVHDGWWKPDPKSGCLDHAPVAAGRNGYHATCRIGRLIQGDTHFYQGLNSWGSDWGWHGTFLMTESEDAEGRMSDGPYSAALPQGWESWEGWRAAIIRA